jgi:PleD family two-component response regulator
MILNKSYDLMTARNGEEAVLKAVSEQPDLILMDVVMPRMNGFQACQQIKQQESTSKIPIIMVTTRGEAESMEKGFEHGCNDYITKPMNRLELLSKVKNYIGE